MKRMNTQWILSLCMLIFLYACSETEESLTDNPVAETPNVTDTTTELMTQWNNLWLELDRYATGMRPNVTARALAYIHLAAYETVVHNIEGHSSLENRFSRFNINQNQRANNVDIKVALNACYAKVFDHFMINVQSDIDSRIGTLHERLLSELSTNLSTSVIENSVDWGNYIALRVIEYSQTDRNAEEQILEPQPLSYEPPIGDGFWTYSADEERALFPYWGDVRTFVISSDQTTSVAPPISYSEDVGSDYYAQMLEVQEVNDLAREENNEQLWIAEFWSDDVEGLMMSPPGRQLSIANQLIVQYNLDYKESIVLLLKLGFSLNDAAVSTWKDKYTYMVMRPNIYIRDFIDPDYQTNLYRFIFWPNPTFPGYPSGHSAFASAAGGVFIDTFGDATDFTDRSHEGRTEFRGTPRQFNTFSQMAEENAFSRIPLGVHIRMDCTEGLRLGYEVSDAVNNFNLLSNQ